MIDNLASNAAFSSMSDRPRRVGSLLDVLGDPEARPILVGTAYDTAWLASVPDPTDPARPRFPASLAWLVDHQLPDGSWGGEIAYAHDRVLSTLAALVAVSYFDRSARRADRIQRGTEYLWHSRRRLRGELVELVGFELLLPALIDRARTVGIAVPPDLDVYGPQREAKLRLITPDVLYSPRATIVHSLEFLGGRADVDGLRRAQGANGSIGNSPATTAFFLGRQDDRRALDYLRDCLDRGDGCRAPVLFPCETFELVWAAYHLFLSGVPAGAILSAAQRAILTDELAAGGVCLSPSFPIADADDTAVALILLHHLGAQVSSSVLERFALADGHFASFPLERHASVGVNVHVLHALLQVPGYPDRAKAVARLVDYILEQQRADGYWIDKWHVSPYYATSHALRVLTELSDDLATRVAPAARRALNWLRGSRLVSGCWGYYGTPTAEETGLAILGLTTAAGDLAWLQPDDRYASLRVLREAVVDLRRWNASTSPPLWIDKCLYTPPLVVRSILTSAVHSLRRRHIWREQVA